MIYQSAEEMVKESQQPTVQLVRLAEVTSLDARGRAKVKFFGEDTESGKTYSYIDGYIPEVGDKVLMLGQANTFIVMGKVTVKEVIVKYALKDHNHDSDYVKKEDHEKHTHSNLVAGEKSLKVTADGEVIPGEDAKYSLGTEDAAFANGYIDNIIVTYITIDGTKLEKDDLISKLIAAGNDDYYVELDVADLVPYKNKGINLGTSSKMFQNVYAQAVYVNGKEVKPSQLVDAITSGRYIELSLSLLVPSANEVISIGTTNKRFLEIYVKKFYGDEFHGKAFYSGDYELSPSKMYSNSNVSRYIDFDGDSLKPNSSGAYNIGTSSYQYKAVYAQNVYVNGSTITTSDKRKKKFIRKLADKYLEFFKKLHPVTFKYKKGTSSRTHAGFVAQEVEQAMQDCGITNEEFGGLVIQDNGEYGLRYEEFIALQTAVIQDLQKRVEELERRVKG